jgi:uncharacterized membrane protein
MIKNIIVTAVIFLGIDFVWLGLIAKSFYDQQFKAFQRKDINWPAALLTYLLLILGISLLALPRAQGDKIMALVYGGLFGLISYGVYDLTNYATLANWPLKLVIVDMIWGTVLCGGTAFLVSLLT